MIRNEVTAGVPLSENPLAPIQVLGSPDPVHFINLTSILYYFSQQ
jgi:hypothetical protein